MRLSPQSTGPAEIIITTDRLHNTPGLPPLSQQELTYVTAALDAMRSLRKTFEFWMVIAEGLKALKDKAERIGGRFTFDRLREREGLGEEALDKGRVSKLFAILANRPKVEEWRARLSDRQRFDWASPEAVHRHCPVFHSDKLHDRPRSQPPQKGSNLVEEAAALREANEQLTMRISELEQERDLARDECDQIRREASAGFGQPARPANLKEAINAMQVALAIANDTRHWPALSKAKQRVMANGIKDLRAGLVTLIELAGTPPKATRSRAEGDETPHIKASPRARSGTHEL